MNSIHIGAEALAHCATSEARQPLGSRLVLIEWEDSFGCSSTWTYVKRPLDAPKPMVCTSVGWLAHDGADCKVLVPHVAHVDDEREQGCGDMTIPTRAVLRIVDLWQVTHPDPQRDQWTLTLSGLISEAKSGLKFGSLSAAPGTHVSGNSGPLVPLSPAPPNPNP